MEPVPDDRMTRLLNAFLAQDKDHAVIGLDTDGRIVGWLAAAERVFGFSPSETLGRSISVLFTPSDQRRGQPEFELDVARRAGRSEDDRWHMRADGTPIWVTGSVTALHDEAGAPIGFVKVMRDRTDLRTHIETLENRVEGQSQRQAALRQMLDTVGHEMRNPLGPLKSAVRLIERQNTGLPLTAPLQIVERQIALLERLANDLLDMTRRDLGRLELQFAEFKLQDLLHDCTTGFLEQARAKGVALELVMPEAPIRMVADPQRVQQVVLNLLGNALKFTGPGGHIIARVVQEARDAAVHIEDDGAGIAPELLPRIFELFSQGGGRTVAAAGGLGIGLALARDIVEMHGGNLEARSPGPGKGSEFSVRLPLRPPGAPS